MLFVPDHSTMNQLIDSSHEERQRRTVVCRWLHVWSQAYILQLSSLLTSSFFKKQEGQALTGYVILGNIDLCLCFDVYIAFVVSRIISSLFKTLFHLYHCPTNFSVKAYLIHTTGNCTAVAQMEQGWHDKYGFHN